MPPPTSIPVATDAQAAGFYPDASGVLRWWDGSQWTEHTTAPPPPPVTAPLQGAALPGTKLAKIGAAIAVAGVAFVAWGILYSPSTSSSTHAVVYELGGTAKGADITITTADGGTSQQQGVAVPLTTAGTNGYTLTVQSGAFLYISAQNVGSGTITCTIVEDGVEVSSNTSSGAYAIATCDGRA